MPSGLKWPMVKSMSWKVLYLEGCSGATIENLILDLLDRFTPFVTLPYSSKTSNSVGFAELIHSIRPTITPSVIKSNILVSATNSHEFLIMRNLKWKTLMTIS